MIDWTVVPTFVTAVVLVLIAPGPDMAYMVAVGIEGGRRAAVRAILGVCSGMVVYVLAVVAGFGALVSSQPWLLTALKIFGAGYLLWLGVSVLRRGKQTAADREHPPSENWYFRGAVVSLTNPKIALFFLAFLPQFIGDADSPAVQMAMLGILDVLIELVLYGAVGLFAARFHTRLAADGRAGMVLSIIACAVYLLLAGAVIVDLLSQLV
ncbi:LysE family translocator [Brevibacterium sp.]|uniref:LysE family translocator n=1 Tax=Brevibacterium sp. TaxID=1701 RepID=UPI002810FC76|nr:LysE family translocator [Brevibacterium sp.]